MCTDHSSIDSACHFQRHGTAAVGALFGPVCALWFLALALVGIYGIWPEPVILQALNPLRLAFRRSTRVCVFRCPGAVPARVPALKRFMPTWAISVKPSAAPGSRSSPALPRSTVSRGCAADAETRGHGSPFTCRFPHGRSIRWSRSATAHGGSRRQRPSPAPLPRRPAIQLGYMPRMRVLRPRRRRSGESTCRRSTRSVGGGSCYGTGLRQFIEAGFSLRRCRYRHHAGNNVPHFHDPLWLGSTCMRARDRILHGRRRRFLLIESAEFADGGWFPLTLGERPCCFMLTWRRGRAILMERLKQSIPLASPRITVPRPAPPRPAPQSHHHRPRSRAAHAAA